MTESYWLLWRQLEKGVTLATPYLPSRISSLRSAVLSSPLPTSLFPAYIPFTWATGRHLQGHHPHLTPTPRLFQGSFRASKGPENDDLVVRSKCLPGAPSTGRVRMEDPNCLICSVYGQHLGAGQDTQMED